MPKYQMYFDTVSGETKYNVDIDDTEPLQDVLDEILFELRERGDMLLFALRGGGGIGLGSGEGGGDLLAVSRAGGTE